MRTRVKICGLTSAEDATAAVDAGADAIGVVLAPSPRQVTVEQAAQVLAAVPPLVSKVGVFVDPTLSELAEAVLRLDLDFVQLSGDEPPGICSQAPVPVLKAIRVGTAFDALAMEPYRGLVAAFILDAHVTGKRGGTGKTFSWHDFHEPPGRAPIFVAGGLDPSNVGEAIRVLHPFAVDVSSGVETSPGRKDRARMVRFLEAVRAADAVDEHSADAGSPSVHARDTEVSP